jgi:Ca2+-binding RTX toxin-like protein
MTTYVTVPGVSGSHVVNPFDNTFNTQVAQAISNTLAAAQTAGNLFIQPYSFSLPAVPSGKVGEITVTSDASGLILVPSGYSYTAIGPDSVNGASPNGPFVVAGGGSLFVGNQAVTYFGSAASGTVSIAAGNGNDLFSLPTGSSYVVGFGNGNDTVYAAGTGTIVGGTGNNLFFADGPHAQNLIVSEGNADTIVAGAGNVTIGTFGTNPAIYGGSGTLTYFGLAAGTPTVSAGTGTETLFGGPGTDMTYLDGGNTGSSTNIFAAGSGNETLNAGGATHGLEIATGTGSLDAIGSKGPDTFYGGAGAATMTGNGGSDVFVFGNTGGHTGGTDIITDFNSSDTFILSGYGANAAATAFADATVTGGNSFVKLSDGTSIEFVGINTTTGTWKTESF